MQTSLTYRTNRDLFSNYYLDEHLPETEAWDEVSEDELRAARNDIQERWMHEKELVSRYNESQLETNFIRPIFEDLGIPFQVEESTSGTQRRPDYGFFESEAEARNAFKRREEGGDFYKNAIAVADAKRWGRPLDTRGSGEHRRDFENPSYQIHVYLQETPARWAVLTDGKKWRLYYGPTSHRLDAYYEVDLPTILEQGDLEDFKYFYLFFRKAAFVEDASGDCFLDDVYNESNVFAQELGEDLQSNIYDAITVLSEGFLQHSSNDLAEDDLDLIHDSSLIYLYRLIFVLYAESEGRDLLNTDNEIYEQSYSLNLLKQDVAEELDSASPRYQDWQTDLWKQLDELFRLIDQGSKSQGIPEEDLYIPAYNGGLFRMDPDEGDSPETRFLVENQVGDSYLAEVIELLTRSKNGTEGEKIFVDYSSLDIRHLGSIYEGLLEYQLNVADEPLVVEDGEYVPAEDGDEAAVEVAVEVGEVYLTTDSGERKATGSYYTPEYVVEYIVENTLGPLVEEIRLDLAGQSAFDEGGFAGEFAERIFELKILDPAMGSGHFLTSAVDYLAREIIDAQEKQAAQEGIETVDEEHDINWARRQVAQRCIYGVDLNPLAVELAKVSLWLRTLAAEQPLAFLDHHLKTGNSLVGSDIETVLDNGDPDNGTEEGQLTLQQSFDRTRQKALEHVTDQFEDLLAIDNETLDDIKEMEAVYEEVRDDPLYQHLLAMANVHTAEQFGLDVPGDAYEQMATALRDDSWVDIEGQDWYRSAQAMAEDERFFHWELEFPIAFYEQDGERMEDGGFDAVIGNPPYVRQEQLQNVKHYFEDMYYVYHGVADLYAYFFERGTNLMNEKAHFGYIVSNKFMQTNYGEPLREYLLRETRLRQIIDFGELPVFPKVSTYTSIIILDKEKSVEGEAITVAKLDDLEFTNLSRRVDSISYSIPHSTFDEGVWSLADRKRTALLNRIEVENTKLVDFLDDGLYRGIVTGLNEVFHIDSKKRNELIQSHPSSEELIQPLLKGDDVNRYEIKEKDRYLLFTRHEIDINDYPAVRNYLKNHKQSLMPKPDDYDDSDEDNDGWPGRKPGDYEWYEIQDKIDHWEKFEEDKIVYPDISKGSNFALDTDGRYLANTCYFIPTNSGYILGVLNASLINWYYRYITSEYRGGYQRSFNQAIKDVPIPAIDSDIPASERAERVSALLDNYDSYLIEEAVKPLPKKDDVARDFLAELAKQMTEFKQKRGALNLNLLDYLAIPSDELPDSKAGETLGDLQMPVARVADTALVETTEEYDSLRVEGVAFADDGGRLVLSVDISYKPDEDDPRETDTWGRLVEDEFETYEAMAFVGLSEAEETLLREFVPVAVEKKGGFADFRQNATKNNSPLDRLKALTLPDIDEVQAGLEQYIEVRERADELDAKIEKTDRLIDEIVYDLYGLTDEEIEIVEEAVGE